MGGVGVVGGCGGGTTVKVERRLVGGAAAAHLHDEHAALDARPLHLDARQRREAHLRLVRVPAATGRWWGVSGA